MKLYFTCSCNYLQKKVPNYKEILVLQKISYYNQLHDITENAEILEY